MFFSKKEFVARSILRACEERLQEGKEITTDEHRKFRDLFGDMIPYDIYDLDFINWNYFLDHVTNLEDFIYGLHLLSPFADDALEVAETMSEQDFYNFKICLAHERRITSEGCWDKGHLTENQLTLILPIRFIEAYSSTEKYDVALGVVLMQMRKLGAQGG